MSRIKSGNMPAGYNNNRRRVQAKRERRREAQGGQEAVRHYRENSYYG